MSREVRGPRRDVRSGTNVRDNAQYRQTHEATITRIGLDHVTSAVVNYNVPSSTPIYSPIYMPMKLPSGSWMAEFRFVYDSRQSGYSNAQEQALYNIVTIPNPAAICIQRPSLNTYGYGQSRLLGFEEWNIGSYRDPHFVWDFYIDLFRSPTWASIKLVCQCFKTPELKSLDDYEDIGVVPMNPIPTPYVLP